MKRFPTVYHLRMMFEEFFESYCKSRFSKNTQKNKTKETQKTWILLFLISVSKLQ